VSEASTGAADHPALAAPPFEDHHRDITGGAARAAVFGVSDGLVSNVALILGVAGASPAPGVVRLAGLAGLVAGAVSMAAGEYVSVKAQVELLERELQLERIELEHRPDKEQKELAGIYMRRGVEPRLARELAAAMSKNPELALHTHAREELGVDPDSLGNPVKAAVASFISFAVGALIPLLPWFLTTGTAAVVASVVVAGLAAIAVGVFLARFTERSWIKSAARQLFIAAVAAAVTFGIGRAVGVGAGVGGP
jgi:vacuolar iron transporter family protein